ncbi:MULTISPECIES: acyl-CoA dehydrogenase family protein [Marinobacter]|uniref:acyl-CoA dehydrogenase family protein n=1 Tax=Marinobacter TaxID=2742 RepID=UPI003B4335D2|nr:acyl-CoA/acyl-ACP dehydrogenase [Marinobacter alkaliphilus]
MSQTAEDSADLDLFLDEARRFVHNRLQPAVSRHETLISPPLLADITREAANLGLLPMPGQEAGYGLWEQPEQAANTVFSLAFLKLTASINAGVAFSWHRYALAVAVARHASLSISSEPLAISLQPGGHYGLARGALARWIASQPGDDDRHLLADWLDWRNHRCLLLAPETWTQVILPVWENDTVNWQLCTRDQLICKAAAPQHGLNELALFPINVGAKDSLTVPSPANEYPAILAADALALASIASGINQHGSALAQDYASIRRQGGTIIRQHPAVQQMLSDIAQAQWQTDTLLQSQTDPVTQLHLAQALMIRQQAHIHLTHSANQVMQVHGGIGYMQDCGPEKLLRDQNTLRMIAGGIRDIPLFINAWQETLL